MMRPLFVIDSGKAGKERQAEDGGLDAVDDAAPKE
jgi:hypothetical protein